jgi:tetratricopeptide (TPR) repeat protein
VRVRRLRPVRGPAGDERDDARPIGMSRLGGTAGPPLLIALVAFAVHGRSIFFGFTDTDDRDLILDDRGTLGHLSSLWRVFARSYMHVVDASHAYYRPVVSASYVLDFQWSGTRPYGYHLTNVALYTVASVLAYTLFRTLALGGALSLMAALVFAVHPALTQATAWIPGRNDSLLAVFVLAAWIAFAHDAERPCRWRKVAHGAFFVLALFTKESAVVLPLVCLAHVALARPADWERLRRSRALGGFAVAWAAIIAGRLLCHPPHESVWPASRNMLASLPLLLTGLGKVLLPVNLSVLPVAEDISRWPGLLACGVMAAACFVGGVRLRIVALGAVAFFLFLAPVTALTGPLMLEERLVLPACGALLAVAEIVRALKLERGVLVASAAAVTTGLALLTVAYAGAFRDPLSFARDAVEGSPHSPLAHLALGCEYEKAGQDDRALSEYHAALQVGAVEVVHNNIAVIAMARGRWNEAEAELVQEIATHPGYGKAHYNLGIVLRHEGRIHEACAEERLAAEQTPDDQALEIELARDCAP